MCKKGKLPTSIKNTFHVHWAFHNQKPVIKKVNRVSPPTPPSQLPLQANNPPSPNLDPKCPIHQIYKVLLT